MTHIITYEQQGSPEWFANRVGIPGASSFDQIVTTKGAPSESRHKLMYQLAGERILGRKEDTYCSPAMLRGITLEPEARSVFEMLMEVEVTQTGFIYYDDRRDRGCSPDGIIDGKAGLEIKCPLLTTHIEYMMGGKLPSKYFQQVHGSMYAVGLERWYFMSYYPGLKPFIVECYRNKEFIKALDENLDLFCQGIDDIVRKIR